MSSESPSKRVRASQDESPSPKTKKGASPAKSPKHKQVSQIRKYHLSHIVKENVSSPILDMVMQKLKDVGDGSTQSSYRDLFATIQAGQANIYEGLHLDLASHFWNQPNSHVPTVADLTCCCWVPVEKDENEAILVLGSADGILQVLSLAQSRIVSRLGSLDDKKKVVDVCPSRREPYIVASLVEDSQGGTFIEMWNVRTEERRAVINVETSAEARRIQYIPTKDTLVVTTEQEMLVFDQGKRTSNLPLPGKTIDVKFANRNIAFLLLADGSCCLYELETKTKRNVFAKALVITCIGVSSCGRYLCAGNGIGEIHLFDTETGNTQTLRSSRSNSFCTSACSFGAKAPDSIVCTSTDGSVWQWRARDDDENVPTVQ